MRWPIFAHVKHVLHVYDMYLTRCLTTVWTISYYWVVVLWISIVPFRSCLKCLAPPSIIYIPILDSPLDILAISLSLPYLRVPRFGMSSDGFPPAWGLLTVVPLNQIVTCNCVVRDEQKQHRMSGAGMKHCWWAFNCCGTAAQGRIWNVLESSHNGDIWRALYNKCDTYRGT